MNIKNSFKKIVLFLIVLGGALPPVKADFIPEKYHRFLLFTVASAAGYGIYKFYKQQQSSFYVAGLPVEINQSSATGAKPFAPQKTQSSGKYIIPTLQSESCLQQQGATCGYHALFNAASWGRYGKLCGQRDFDWLYARRGSLPAENVGIGDLVQLRDKYCSGVQIFGKTPDGRWIIETKANASISSLQNHKKTFSAVLHVPGHWIALKFSYEKGEPSVVVADSNGGGYTDSKDVKEISRIVFNAKHDLPVIANKGNLVAIGTGDAFLRS